MTYAGAVNDEWVVLPSAARTAAETPSTIQNRNARGLLLFVDVTSVTDTPSITPKVEVQDPASGKWVDLLGATAITGTGTSAYYIHPGGDTTTQGDVTQAVLVALPETFRINVTHADTDSITYSVGACLLI